MADCISLWTRQSQQVVDALLHDGHCSIRKAYIEAKYQQAGWSFQIAYGFFIQHMGTRLPPQAEEESPYWLHGTAEATGVFSDTPLLHLEVPVEHCLFFDQRKWNKILNLEYLANTNEEAAAFQKKLTQQGLHHASQVFRVPHYPALKQEIQKSWLRLFQQDRPEPAYLQAAVWHLERSWCQEIFQP